MGAADSQRMSSNTCDDGMCSKWLEHFITRRLKSFVENTHVQYQETKHI